MDGNVRGWGSCGKGNTPGQRSGAAIIIANQEAPDPAESVTDAKGGRGRGDDRDDRPMPPASVGERSADAAKQAAKPTQPAATGQQREERVFMKMFGDKKELCSD